jgi:vacuolar-type H+-ATPase subunit H
MASRPSAQTDAAVEAAIARILDAERMAHEAVSRARAEATAIAEAARARARATAQRTENRLRCVQVAYEAATQAALDQLAASATAAGGRDVPTAVDRDRLARAVVALAARLTGG